MLSYTIRRLLLIVPTLFVVLVVTFALAHAAPGGPWDKEEAKRQSPAIIDNLNRKYGLDRPLPEQFGLYLWNVLHGDLGVSLSQRDREVKQIIGDALPVSARLGVQAILLALAISVPLGVISALRQNSAIDYASLLLATAGTSIPSFVLAIFAIYVFAVIVPWFPVSGWGDGDMRHVFLPSLVLAVGSCAFLTRITRASVLEVIRQDYVRTARAKGLHEHVVVAVHVLRNALIPVVTVLGPATAFIITGTFFIEYMFSIPGLGRWFVNSLFARDYPLLLGIYLLFAFVISLANLTVDLLYGVLDPRIKVAR